MLTSKKIAVLLLSASISLGAFEAQAAKNLVGATLANTSVDAGFTASLPSQLRVGIASPVEYRLTNNVGIDIQGFAVKPVLTGPATFNVVSNDCPALLPVGASCDFKGTVTATAAGQVTLQVKLVEGGNTFLLHKDTATAVLQAPNLVASSTLASQYFANASNNHVEFTFTNKGVDTAVISSVNLSDSAGLLSQIINNCSGATVASGASCKISGLLNSGRTVGTYNINFTFNYNEATSGSDVLKADFSFPVTVLEPSTLTVTSAPSKLVAYSGEMTQGIVTLKNTGTGTIVDIKATLDTDNNGTLALATSSIAACEGTLSEGQSCNELVDFSAPKQDLVNDSPSYKSALAALTISYQDGKGGKPLHQSVLAVQVDHGYFINTTADLPGMKNQLPSNVINAMTFANDTLYVGTPSGLSMSKDHGTTWIDSTVLNGLPSNDVTAVFANSKNIFVATDSGIAVSTDGGFYFEALKNWTTAYGVPQAIAQTSDNTVYVGTTTGLYSNASGTFTQLTDVPSVSVTALGTDISDDVYAIANHALYVKTSSSSSFVVATSTDGSCSQINGITTSVGNITTKLLVASNCGLLSFDGVTLSGMIGSSANLLAVAVTSGKANIYGINSADGSLASWNNVSAQPWVFNATNLQSPANFVTLDSDGVHIYVGSSTGGFAVGTIDASNPLSVAFSAKNSLIINKVLANDENVYLATDKGLMWSTDKAQTFTVASAGTTLANPLSDISLGQYVDGTPALYAVDSVSPYNLYVAPLSDVPTLGTLGVLHNQVLKVGSDNAGAEYHSTTLGDVYHCVNNGLNCTKIASPGVAMSLDYVADNLYLGTPSGLKYFNGTAFTAVKGINASVGSVVLGSNGDVYVPTSEGIYTLSGPTSDATLLYPTAGTSLAISGDALYVISNGQLLMTKMSPAK